MKTISALLLVLFTLPLSWGASAQAPKPDYAWMLEKGRHYAQRKNVLGNPMPDMANALFYLEQVAENAQGDLKNQAYYWIGYSYLENLNKEDDHKAFEAMMQAAEAGHVKALGRVGYMYGSGTGVEKNEREALIYIEKAAQLNDQTSLYNLGTFYEYGQQKPLNLKEALRLYEKSANLGHALAMQKMAFLNFLGKGTETNHKKAYYWIIKSIQHGNIKAKRYVEEIKTELTPADIASVEQEISTKAHHSN